MCGFLVLDQTSELREGVVSVCAMLNKHGEGTLYFGVKNDGTVVGQEIGAKTMRDVGRAIMEHISPVIYPTIEEEQHGGMNIVKVTFEGSEQPYQAYHVPRHGKPRHRFKAYSGCMRCYWMQGGIRAGSI